MTHHRVQELKTHAQTTPMTLPESSWQISRKTKAEVANQQNTNKSSNLLSLLSVKTIYLAAFAVVNMANIAVQRIKREFKEVVKSEEVCCTLPLPCPWALSNSNSHGVNTINTTVLKLVTVNAWRVLDLCDEDDKSNNVNKMFQFKAMSNMCTKHFWRCHSLTIY